MLAKGRLDLAMGGGEMKATVNGVTVEGTPAEIAELTKLSQRGQGLAERIVATPPVVLGPPKPGSGQELLEREAHERQMRVLEQAISRIPNVNITPLGRVCTGDMRFC
jgi:hypothetical protein